MATMTAPTGTGYTQTPEEQAREERAWRALRAYVGERRVLKGKTFLVRGRLVELKGDKDNPGQPRRIPNTYPGAKSAFREVMLAVAEVTEPGLAGLEFVKNVGYTFWDGGPKNGPKGGMYLLHQAVLQEEPPRELIDGGGAFDPDDYCKRPLLLSLMYNGDIERDSQYYGKRDNLDVYLAGFEPDPEAFVITMPSGSIVTTSGLPQTPVAAPARPAPPQRPLPPTVAAGPPTLTDDQMQRVRDHFKAEGWGAGAEIAAWCVLNYDGRGLAQLKAEEWDGLVETLGMVPF